MLGEIDKELTPYEHRLFLCKPDRTTIEELREAFDINLTLLYGAVHRLSFSLPYVIEKNKKYIRNPHVDLVRGHYLIRYEKWDNNGNILTKEYFIISKPKNIANDGIEVKQVQCYLLPYELKDKIIRDYKGTKKLQEILTDTLLYKTDWAIGTIDYHVSEKYRTFDISEKNLLDFIIEDLAETFDVVPVWDTVNKKVSFYKSDSDILGTDKGLTIEYGKYLKTIEDDPDFDEVVTRLYAYGNEGISINKVNPTGTDYVEDFSYYMYPFERDENRNVVKHSYYMTDSLCHALLDYYEFLETKKPITKTAESGTTTTNIKITNHGLVVGDYIVNVDRQNTYRKVKQVIDANTFVVDAIENQRSGDTINLFKDGTFGKLLYIKEDLQKTLTTKENELTTLNTELQIILDQLDVANATGQNTSQIIANKNAKQAEINAKQTEINNIKNQITSVDSQIVQLRNEINIENHLTPEQIIELNPYIKERVWLDNNYNNEYELYQDAVTRLKRLSQPIVKYDIDIIDFLKVVTCQKDWNKLNLGDIVTIRYPNFNIDIKAKIITIEHDIDNNSIKLTIANDKDIKSGLLMIKDLLKQTVSSSTSIDMNKFKWDKSEENGTLINELINSKWDATKREIQAGVNESVEISRRGIRITDPNDPNRMLIAQHSVLALTNDGGQSWKHCITPDGIVGENIYGKLGAFCQVRANQIVVGDGGEKIQDNVIASATTWNNSVQKGQSYSSAYIDNTGIYVKDNNNVERVRLGQYEPGKYGVVINSGEIYSTTIKSGGKNATSYVYIGAGYEPIRVVENNKTAMTIWSQNGGMIQFYDTIANDMSGQITPYNDAIGQGLRINGRNNAGSSTGVNIQGSEFRVDADSIWFDSRTFGDTWVTIRGDLNVTGRLFVSDNSYKNALQQTISYGRRFLYSRESPEPKYQDEGIAELENGICKVQLDPIFIECIEPNTEQAPWIIHLTPYDDIEIRVKEIGLDYFVVEEKNRLNGKFSWSLSAVSKGNSGKRFEQYDEVFSK